MTKITKETCVVLLKDYYKSKIILYIFISAFIVLLLRSYTKNIYVVIVAALLLVMLCVYQGIITISKINNINSKDFYIEEDVVVGFKKRFRLRRHGAENRYIYTFNKHGKHIISLSINPTIEIPLHKKRNISRLSIDRLSAESCFEGDNFYLLICDEGHKKKIVQSFYRRHFELQREDFDYLDGKYYCKEI